MTPSDIIRNCTFGIGSLVQDCRCSRVHYATSDSSLYEDGELEDLEYKHIQNKDKYIPHNDYSISSRIIFENRYVIGCPCNWEEKLVKNLWDNKEWVIEVLIKITEEKTRESQKATDLIQKYDNTIKSINNEIRQALDNT